MESIIIRIIDLIITFASNPLQKDYKIGSYLKKVGLLKLEANFNSRLIHSLIEYGKNKSNLIFIKILSNKELRELFQKGISDNNLDDFNKKAEYMLYKELAIENITLDKPNEELINNFITIYDTIDKQTESKTLLDFINKTNAQLLELTKTNYENSFPYQSEKYLKHLIKEFNKEFPKNKYIEQKGETRETVINFGKDISNILKQKKIKHSKKTQYRNKKMKLSYPDFDIMDFKDVITTPLDPIDKYINEWINDESQNFLLIMGEYGTGKTALCKHIAKELANTYSDKQTKIIDDKHKRIVFLFNLRNFKAENVEDYIYAFMMRNQIRDFGDPDLYNRIENKELIFIFDGFDEMTQKIDTEEKKANFLQIEKLIRERKNSKVILTSREEYFTFDEELNEVFKNKENDNYKIIYLNLFDDEQIKAYLETHTDNAQFYLDKIKEIYDLSDLAPRPVLLDFIVKYLPKLIKEKGEDLTINASDLYRTGIQTELEKKSREVTFLNKKLPTQKRLLLLQKLSVWMHENNTLIIDTSIIKETLDLEKFFNVKEDYEIIKYLNIFLNFTFLTKESDYIFRISHKSFRDYLVATELVKEINSGTINVFGKQQTSSEINHFIFEMKPARNKLKKMITEEKEITEQNKWQKNNAFNLLIKLRNPNYNSIIDFNENELNINQANISDIEPLKELKNLTVLRLWENQISNIEPLKELKKLTVLSLYDNQIINIEPLRELKNLIELNLSRNPISNIELLKEFKNLTVLSLWTIKIINLEPLGELKNLTELNLFRNQISNIEALKELKNLTLLDLSENQISNIEPLVEMKKLTLLDLSENQISNIEPLRELKNFTELRLYKNQIINIKPLKELGNLTVLWLHNNKITDIEPLKELKKLSQLILAGNQISDIGPLKELKNLTSLDLTNNPLKKAQIEELEKALPETDINF